MHIFHHCPYLSTKIFVVKILFRAEKKNQEILGPPIFLNSQARLDLGSSSKAPGSGSARARKFQARSTPMLQ